MERKRCPELRQSMFFLIALCDLNGKPCILETDGGCSTYGDWLFEERQAELNQVGKEEKYG